LPQRQPENWETDFQTAFLWAMDRQPENACFEAGFAVIFAIAHWCAI